jgi:ATP-binding cassette, subfamily B (MDR/TAP), member 1
MRDTEGDQVFSRTAKEITSSTITDGCRLEFKDVFFSYPTRPVSILKSLEFKIEKGQFAAIVGPSGMF